MTHRDPLREAVERIVRRQAPPAAPIEPDPVPEPSPPPDRPPAAKPGASARPRRRSWLEEFEDAKDHVGDTDEDSMGGVRIGPADGFMIAVERRRTDRAQERERGRWRRRAGPPARPAVPAAPDPDAAQLPQEATELHDAPAGKGPAR